MRLSCKADWSSFLDKAAQMLRNESVNNAKEAKQMYKTLSKEEKEKLAKEAKYGIDGSGRYSKELEKERVQKRLRDYTARVCPIWLLYRNLKPII